MDASSSFLQTLQWMKFEVIFMFWKALSQNVYPLQIGSLMVEVYDLKKRR